MQRWWFAFLVLAFLSLGKSARADEVSVAVAANFVGTLEKLAVSFQKATGHRLNISAGSSGQLYAQAKAGAPYEVFLSADADRPRALEREGLGVKGTRFVYARGRLALWSKKADFMDARGQALKQGKCSKLGIADPRTAPYGSAAEHVLKRLGLWDNLNQQARIVLGASVTHAYQFAASGNADCAFVAYSQVLAGSQDGSFWLLPDALYPALNQEAILLKAGDDHPAAEAFLRWLKTDRKALTLVRDAGYALAER